ncbi:hypothetical protein BH09PSE2_BH09PSE2_03450 [soil metagenome]
MALDPERALIATLIAHLCAAPALNADLGDPPRVYDEPPDRPTYPYLSIGRAQSTPRGGDASEGVEQVLTLTVVSRYGGTEEAHRIKDALRTLLDDARLTLNGHRLVSLQVRFADVFRASDWRSIYGVIRLRAVTEPLQS